MAGRYDSRTTIFSPEGRLYQVEYAMETISKAAACIGVRAKDGVVLAAEKRLASKLLDQTQISEKMYLLDDNVACSVAGIDADANILISKARVAAQRYKYAYDEDMPVEQLVRALCDVKQSYTQFGGLRPFGVSFLYAGWDEHLGFQLYKSDPSGNYAGWKASAMGANYQQAQSSLKQEYVDECSLDEALALAVRVLSKCMESTSLSSDKVEFAKLTKNAQGKVVFQMLSTTEITSLIASVDLEKEVKE